MYTDGIYPKALEAQVSVFPYKRLWGSLGAGILFRFADLQTLSLSGRFYLFNLDFMYDKKFPDLPLAVTGKLGGGVALINNIQYPASESETSLQISANAGALVKYYFWRDFFAYSGVDFTLLFSGTGLAAGFFTPGIGVGWKY
jgi:hypothetical protein